MAIGVDITALYDKGLGAVEIAASLGIDEAIVRQQLEQHSAKFRAGLKTGAETRVSTEIVAQMLDVVQQVALTSPDYGARLRAATYLIDEASGRHDKPSSTGPQLNLNLIALNNALKTARGVTDSVLEIAD